MERDVSLDRIVSVRQRAEVSYALYVFLLYLSPRQQANNLALRRSQINLLAHPKIPVLTDMYSCCYTVTIFPISAHLAIVNIGDLESPRREREGIESISRAGCRIGLMIWV